MGTELQVELSQPFPHGGGQATVEVEVLPTGKEHPATRHVVLLVDTSFSMSGRKIDYTRSGILKVLNDLQPEDKVSIVSFNSTSRVVAGGEKWQNCDQESIRRKVAGTKSGDDYDGDLVIRGSTNIKKGLKKAKNQFEDDESIGSKDVILLSDMKDDDDIDALRDVASGMGEEGITVTAGGIGSDYNEDVLLAIAEASGGDPHHLEDESDIESFFQERAQESKKTVASSPSLEVELNEEYYFAPDEMAVFIEPGVRSEQIRKEDHIGKISLPTLRDGERQRLTFEVMAPHRPTGLSWEMGELRVVDKRTLASITVEVEHEDNPTSKTRIEKQRARAKVTESIKKPAVDKEAVEEQIDEIEKERGWQDTADELRKRLAQSEETGGKINISKRKFEDDES